MFSTPRPWCLTTRSLMGLVLVGAVALAPSAHADPPPQEERLHITLSAIAINQSATRVLGMDWEFAQPDDTSPTAGTQIHVRASSCGRFLQENTKTMTGRDGLVTLQFIPDRGSSQGPRSVERRVGPSIDYVIDIIQPGYDSYQFAGSRPVSGRTGFGQVLKRPTCKEILEPLVPSWSQKDTRGSVVGTTIAITPTSAPEARVTYAWKLINPQGKAAGRTMGTQRRLRLTPAWIGRRVAVIITVRKSAYRPQSRTIVFSKVHRG